MSVRCLGVRRLLFRNAAPSSIPSSAERPTIHQPRSSWVRQMASFNSANGWCRGGGFQGMASLAVQSVQRERAACCARARGMSSSTETSLVNMTSKAVQFVPEFPLSIRKDLRTDHAGEFGAVQIYRGALAAARLRERLGLNTEGGRVIEFAEHHMETEQRHLDIMLQLVPPSDRTKLLPMWRLMARSLGFFPTLLGPRQLYWTIVAVETFVEQHYLDQIEKLQADRILPELSALLVKLKDEEVEHRDEAAAALFGRKDAPEAANPSGVAKAWMLLVEAGSKAAVQASKVV